MDDNFKFSPWPKKDSKTFLEGLLLGFSRDRAIGIIVERISKLGTKYRRRGLGTTWPLQRNILICGG
jgi:hypothetical protein